MHASGGAQKSPRRVLVTGGAGFIGSHLVEKLLAEGLDVCVIDNFDDFYDLKLKRQHVENHRQSPHYTLIEGDIRDAQVLGQAAQHGPFDTIVHLAALAGVRPSLLRPNEYVDVNVRGTQKVIDLTRSFPKARLVFASSSSVYGSRSTEAFVETDRVDQPESPYAASKAAAELICHAAHQCFALEIMCLRFFTVFGPRQRPDLAINKFCHLIESGQPIELFGDGSTRRDYTYIEDTVSGITAAMRSEFSGFEIINLGRGEPITLNDLVACIEKSLGKQAKRIYKDPQLGDVPNTHASIEKAARILNYAPKTTLTEGIDKFVEWYRDSQKNLLSPIDSTYSA